jgi:hypothetical protein
MEAPLDVHSYHSCSSYRIQVQPSYSFEKLHATEECVTEILASPVALLSVNCESRNTKLNVRCFGDYIHLEEDKQQGSKPCRTPRSYIKLARERF